MKVILKERIENLGGVGDVVEVKDGYARNFLLPKNKALLSTPQNLKYIENHKRKLELIALKEENEAKELAKAIEGIVITVVKKAVNDEKLFGSVSPDDIIEQLEKQNIEIDKKKILITEPIKKVGEYTVNLRLYPGVEPGIKVIVEPEKDESDKEKLEQPVEETTVEENTENAESKTETVE
jgi:large subunit ribosomal protein L9